MILLTIFQRITLSGKDVAKYENNFELCLIKINQVIKELWQISLREMKKNGQ